MNARSLVLLIIIAAGYARGGFAQARAGYLTGVHSAAVDASGVRHRSEAYPNRLPPWMVDRVKAVSPDYPYNERAQHHTGRCYFRLTLDLKTGAVTRIALLKSTGFPTLDACAATALQKWQWKPGRWKEVDFGVLFVLSKTEPNLPPGSVALPLR